MQIEYLYYFVDVSKTLSISKSAAKFYMSQQGLSRAIQALEEEFDIILLERKRNTIKLSSAGEEFVKQAQNVIDSYEKLKHLMEVYNRNKNIFNKSSVILNATPHVFNYLLPLLNEQLFTDLYNIGVTALEMNIYNILKEIAEFKPSNSLYLISIPNNFRLQNEMLAIYESDNIFFSPLMQTTLLAVVSNTSTYAYKKKLTAADMQKLSFACQNDPVLLKCISSSINPDNIAFTSNNLEFLKEMVLKNFAAGFIPAFSALHSLPEGLTAIPFENSYDIIIGFLTDITVDYDESVFQVMNYIKNYCRNCLPGFAIRNGNYGSIPLKELSNFLRDSNQNIFPANLLT